MKTLNFVKILLLCAVISGLASCGDDKYYTEIQNSDDKLCGKTWTEKYTDEEGNTCVHKLEFSKVKVNNKDSNSGKETTITYKTGKTESVSKDFTWQWVDNSMEGLVLSYGSGDVVYFENVWVREHYLSGKLGERMIVLSDRAISIQ